MKISMIKDSKGPVIALIIFVMFILCMAAGWVTNVIWTFQQDTVQGVLLGLLGCLLAPVGALHGIYTWF